MSAHYYHQHRCWARQALQQQCTARPQHLCSMHAGWISCTTICGVPVSAVAMAVGTVSAECVKPASTDCEGAALDLRVVDLCTDNAATAAGRGGVSIALGT